MTGNAHKRILPQIIVNTDICKGRRDYNTIKTDCSAETVVAFTITEINYLTLISSTLVCSEPTNFHTLNYTRYCFQNNLKFPDFSYF